MPPGNADVPVRGWHRVTADLVDRALAQMTGWSLPTFSLDGQTRYRAPPLT